MARGDYDVRSIIKSPSDFSYHSDMFVDQDRANDDLNKDVSIRSEGGETIHDIKGRPNGKVPTGRKVSARPLGSHSWPSFFVFCIETVPGVFKTSTG